MYAYIDIYRKDSVPYYKLDKWYWISDVQKSIKIIQYIENLNFRFKLQLSLRGPSRKWYA